MSKRKFEIKVPEWRFLNEGCAECSMMNFVTMTCSRMKLLH